MDLTSRSLLMASAVDEAFSTTAAFVTSATQVMSTTSSATTFTLSGIQADDVVFFSHVADATTVTNLKNNTSDLSSWTEFVDGTLTDSNGNSPAAGAPGRSIFYKVATGTSTSVNLTYIPVGDNNEYACVMFAFRGLNTSVPIVAPRLVFGGTNSLTAAARENPSYDTYNVAWQF